MKHLLLVLLALLLTGCTPESPDTTAHSTQPSQVSTSAAELIGQPAAIHSDRALSTYDTGLADCRDLCPMGTDMLLISGEDETVLSVLSGNQAFIRAQKVIPCPISPDDGSMQVNKNGIAYYDSRQNTIVYLNTDLLEIRRISLPYPFEGKPFLSDDWATIYYCADNAIHALDLETGTPRLLRSHNVVSQAITGLHLTGQLLSCCVTYPDGRSEDLYISTQTGESFYPGWDLTRLYTDSDTYFAAFRDGTVNLWVTGTPGNDPFMIHTAQTAEVIPLYSSDAVALLESGNNGTEFSYLDMVSGRRTGAITMNPSTEVISLSGNNGIVWFLAKKTPSEPLLLYRWTPAWSRVWNPRSYYRTYYTAENPDTEELQRLAYRAKKLGESYGIRILIGQDPLTYQPSGHTFQPEHQVVAYQRDLAVLEAALANFPQNFFKNAAFGTKNRHLTVSLVRDVLDETNREHLPGKQYWHQESAYITLVMGEELERSFYHQLCHIIDTRVMGTTSAYDDWADLNPEGVVYANSYSLSQIETEETWFSGDSRIFIDPYSMSFPREDRARILEYAMTPGNKAVFVSETMQRKLATLCQGIREAFDLKKDQVCLWEQYLITESE